MSVLMEEAMRHVPVLAAVCVMLVACGTDAVAPPDNATLPTWVVSGFVRDEAGIAVPRAAVELLSGLFGNRLSIADDSGFFSLERVRGPITIHVSKDGFEYYSRYLVVADDLTLLVRLPRLEGWSDIIRLGQTIRSTVEPRAAPCDPMGWDAQAPCRRFPFTAPASGALIISIAWHGGSRLDAIIALSDGTYVATSDDTGLEQITVLATVGAGEKYQVYVNSYYDRQVFDLKADLIPLPGR
jgi:hypothetical protein